MEVGKVSSIVSFDIEQGNNHGNTQSYNNTAAGEKAMQAIFKTAATGDQISLKHIKVKQPDGTERTVSDINITVT